jgi:hypothetical protein
LSSLNWIDKKVPSPSSLSKFRGSDQTQYERIRAPGFGEVITPSLTGPDRGRGGRYSERGGKTDKYRDGWVKEEDTIVLGV